MSKQPNYYCLHCPHSGAMHSGPRMRCGGLDAAGDTCDCEPFVAATSSLPMEERKPSKVKSIKGETSEQHEKNLRVTERFTLASDESGHEYVIPVAKKAEFNKWNEMDTESEEFDCELFDEYRIDGGLLTFTDPKVN